MSAITYPKDILCAVYSPDRRLAEFIIKKKNIPGALAKIANAMEKMNINILSGFLTAIPNEVYSFWSFFADLTDVNLKTEVVVEEIKKIDVVSEVNFNEPKLDGLIIDDIHFPLLVSDERSVTFRVDTMVSMFNKIYQIFGSGGKVIIFEMGVEAGENKVKKIYERYGMKGLKALELILAERIAKGWGIPESNKFDLEKKECIVQVKELFECSSSVIKEESGSQFFRGYLTGILSQIFEKKVLAEETECMAKGDPYCGFHIM